MDSDIWFRFDESIHLRGYAEGIKARRSPPIRIRLAHLFSTLIMVKFSSIFVLASIALGAVATPLHPSCSTEQVVNNTQGISSSCSALQIVVDNVDAATCNASAIVEVHLVFFSSPTPNLSKALLPAIHNLVILITTATDDCKVNTIHSLG